MSAKIFRTGLLAAMIVTLAACGGGGDSDSKPVTLTGSLIDSPIAGVAYLASPSGKSGITDAGGHYNYIAGDTVTFSVGSIALGTVPATGTITPVQLGNDGNSGTDDSNAVTNLLVFFQSLDSDGDPDNGITILSQTATAATVNLDFTQSPTTFAALTAFTDLIAATNTATGTSAAHVVSPTAALAEFKAQFLAKVTGVWVLYASNGSAPAHTLVVRFDGNTRQYMAVEAGVYDLDSAPPVPASHTGTEVGSFDWDPLNTRLTVTPTCFSVAGCTADSNGDWGLSAMGQTTFITDGSELVARATNTGSVAQFRRIAQAENALNGAWVLGNENFVAPMLVFLTAGSGPFYLYADPFGDGGCGHAGAELGNFWGYSAGTHILYAGPAGYLWRDLYNDLGQPFPDGVRQGNEIFPIMDTDGCRGLRMFDPEGHLAETIGGSNVPIDNFIFIDNAGYTNDSITIDAGTASQVILYRIPNDGTVTIPAS